MKVDREKLLNALEYVRPGLSSRGQIDQFDCFVFKEGYIYSYNDEVACRCKSPLPDVTGAVLAAPLLDILHRLKEKELRAKQKKKSLLFEGKNKRIQITMEREITLPIEDLDYPKKKEWKVLPAKFADAIQFVQGCASRDDSEQNLTHIHLHPKMVEAFDNYQMARFLIKLPLKNEICVRQIALRNISSMTMIEFCETDNWIHFRDARKHIFSCRVYLEEWLSLDDIIKVKGEPITLPKGLIEASGQAGVFSTDSQNPNENYIEVTLTSKWAHVKGEGQFGKYTGKRPLRYSGPKFTFMIHPKILEELVKDHSDCILSEKAMKAQSGKAIFVTSLTPPKKKKVDQEIEKQKKKGKK